MAPLKILLITQARIGSSRFPSKVTAKLAETTLLGLHLKRVKKSKLVTDFCVATTHEPRVDVIIDIANKEGVEVFQGSLLDVLDRFYQASLFYSPDIVVRVTSDCPLLDGELVDKVIKLFLDEDLDYAANILVEDFPDGQDIEVFTFKALEKAWIEATTNADREHVTPYIRNNSSFKGGKLFRSADYKAPENFNHVRMTVDEAIDLAVMQWLIKELGTDKDWLTYTKHMLANPDKLSNARIQRNEGYFTSLKKESE